MATIDDRISQRIYWHRELPPLNAEMISERVLEERAPACPAHSHITASYGIAPTRHDDATGEAWLYGRFM